jgi:capsular polysaccharide biosynthesis protein
VRTTSYRQALRARWFAIVATAAIVTCLAVIAPPAPVSYSNLSTRLVDIASPAREKYQATAVIGVPPLTSGGDAAVQFKTIQFYVQSTGVGHAFAKRLHYSGSDYVMLGKLIVITADDKAGVMTVTGFGGTKQQAADIANAFTASVRDYLSGLGTQATEQSLKQAQVNVDSLKKRIDDLSAQITALRGSGLTASQAADNPQVTQLQAEHDALVQSYTVAYQHLASVSAGGGASPATAGIAQLQPAVAATAQKDGPGLLYELWLRILLGVVVGLALGAALALLLEHNARKIFSRETAEDAFRSRVLVEIPRKRRSAAARDVAVMTAPGSRAASAYRMLRVILLSEHSSVGQNGHRRLPRHTRPALAMAPARELAEPATPVPSVAVPVGAGDETPSGNGTPEAAAVPVGAASVQFDPERFAVVVAATANEPTHAAVVANLAATFAVGRRPVTVLRIAPAARHNTPRDPGVQAGGPPPTRETSVAGVRLVEWRPEYGGPSAADVLENLQADGGTVLVDAGRVATAEFAEIAPLIDGVVVVCQLGRTTVENAARTADIVAWSHARLYGVVLTQVSAKAIERVTWGRWRRSPLTSRRGLRGRFPGGHDPDDAPGAERRADDELGLLGSDGARA